jgi:hypothetical protein
VDAPGEGRLQKHQSPGGTPEMAALDVVIRDSTTFTITRLHDQ